MSCTCDLLTDLCQRQQQEIKRLREENDQLRVVDADFHPQQHVADEVLQELTRANAKHGSRQASMHEAYAILLEETDELWDEIKKRRADRSVARLREESAQVGCTAIRFLMMLPAEGDV